MIVDVIEANYLHDYTTWVPFDDGTSGEIDLADQLEGSFFEPLRDVDYFRQFSIPKDLGRIAWPNGADFAPNSCTKSHRSRITTPRSRREAAVPSVAARYKLEAVSRDWPRSP